MTYDEAVKTLVDAGLLNEAETDAATAALASSSVDFTYPAWAEALSKAGLIDQANIKAATAAMEKAGRAEAEDDPEAFDDALENADIL